VTAVVEVENLVRTFGDVTALDGVSFAVEAGAMFGVVGPDGAGKTTLLRILSGVLRCTSGDARLFGQSMTSHAEEVRPRIAYMPQRFGLYADLTVRENIDFYAELYGVTAEERSRRLDRLYGFSRLGPFRERLAGQLSGGMKQKLGLCCALIHQPELLLLDEPTFGVDPLSRRDLWLILHEMVAEGVTAVVSTSYLDEAERCDRVAMLDGGRLVALDDPAALQAGYAGTVVIVRASDPRRAADLLATVPAAHRPTLFGETVHVTLADAARDWPAIASALEAGGVSVLDHERAVASLEDVFLEQADPKGLPDGRRRAGGRAGGSAP
jgi:ABC-2 type transport system ATP-binding protein